MQAITRFIYGPTPQEKVREWQRELRKETRSIDREISHLNTASNKTRTEVRKLANKNDTKNAKILAREIVRSNKQQQRLHTSKAQLNSIQMQLNEQLATVKVTGSLQKSAEIMKLSNSLMKLPQLSQTMRHMSEEFMKAGIISEMLDDTFESIDDDEELEEEAQEEVDKILLEITQGKMGATPASSTKVSATAEAAGPAKETGDAEMDKVLSEFLGS